jgi:chloramphenicol 3-O phosphotransferase
MARVVFLNGASSAGKTSVGKALQDLVDEPFLLLGLDTCFGMVPVRWGSKGALRGEGFAYNELPSDGGHPMVSISYGDVGWQIMAGFHRAVVELVRAGNSVIVDEVLLDERVRDDWLDVLAPFRPLLVGVYCDVAELARREAYRANPPGLARWSASQAHTGMRYDVTVDTTNTTPEQSAGRIVLELAGGDGGEDGVGDGSVDDVAVAADDGVGAEVVDGLAG